MPYTNGNINFVLESDFKPFSLQEMLMPFTAYKEEFEKAENAYQELSEKSDKFKYLSKQLPEGSEARQIYEGYANDLSMQAEDIARNGLSMRNRRALTSLKRRYTGEIGRLDIAQTALEKEKEMRRARGLQDSSMLYAVDNMTVDDFLDGKNPNLYGVSGNELYTRGAAAGKAASMRVFSAGDAGKTLGGYYRDYVERMGYNADTIAKFRADISTIPELQQAAEAILQERGVSKNLSGANYERAKQSVINGIIDGAVYQEQHKPMQDLGVMTAAQVAADARQREAHALAREQFNFEKTRYNDAKEKQDQLDHLIYQYDDSGKKIIGYKKDLSLPSGYWVNPVSGKVEKQPSETQTQQEKDEMSIGKAASLALNKLKGPDMKSNSGFSIDVQTKTGVERRHYSYAGAISQHRGKGWQSDKLGEDVNGRGWGFTSSSNVMDKWGNYSAENISNNSRVLGENEITPLVVASTDANGNIVRTEVGEHIAKLVGNYMKEHHLTDEPPYEVIEVPNSTGSRVGYLVAIRDK